MRPPLGSNVCPSVAEVRRSNLPGPHHKPHPLRAGVCCLFAGGRTGIYTDEGGRHVGGGQALERIGGGEGLRSREGTFKGKIHLCDMQYEGDVLQVVCPPPPN